MFRDCLSQVKLPVYYRHKPELFFSFLIKVKPWTLLHCRWHFTLKVRPNIIPSSGHRAAAAAVGWPWALHCFWHALQQESSWLCCHTLHSRVQTFKVHSEIHLKSRPLFGTHSCWSAVDKDTAVRAFWWRGHDCWPCSWASAAVWPAVMKQAIAVSWLILFYFFTCFNVYISCFLPYPVFSFICLYNIQYIFFYIYVMYLGVVWSYNQVTSMLVFFWKAEFTFLSKYHKLFHLLWQRVLFYFWMHITSLKKMDTDMSLYLLKRF